MEFSLSTPHYPHTTTPFSTTLLTSKHHSTTTTSLSFSLKPTPPPPPNSDNPTTTNNSNQLRRPKTLKTTPPHSPNPKPTFKIPKNPFKNLVNPTPVPTTPTPPINPNSHSLINKLWLTSKLSPPPPPPPQPPPPAETQTPKENEDTIKDNEPEKNSGLPRIEFRQEGKIFVGNLPNWVKKIELAEFFRQFGPINNVILIKGHDNTERNAGFGFVIYGGPAAAKSAMKAVEFDGVEFHGRVLTVRLDDGKRLKDKAEERTRWVEGYNGVEYRSKWHKEREGSRKDLRKVMETEPENWQAVVRSFEKIKKVTVNDLEQGVSPKPLPNILG